MATKKDLENEVSRLNNKFFKNDKNHLTINGAYGGYMVGITGRKSKSKKHGYKRLKWSEPGLDPVGNAYHDTASKTITALLKAESNGSLKRKAKHHRIVTRERSKQKDWYPKLKKYY